MYPPVQARPYRRAGPIQSSYTLPAGTWGNPVASSVASFRVGSYSTTALAKIKACLGSKLDRTVARWYHKFIARPQES